MRDDPAPAAGADPATGRRWRRWGWLFGGVWLVFLVNPLLPALRNPDHALGGLAVGALCAFGAVYLRTLSLRAERRELFGWAAVLPSRTAWTTIASLVVLAALVFPGAGVDAASAFVFIAVCAQFTLPLRQSLPFVVAIAVGCLVAGLVVPAWDELLSIALSIALAGLAVYGVTSTARRGRELAVAQQDLARLAVAEERSRVARDLHDLLGHSLTVVTLKAQLAGRLLESGTEQGARRAAGEVAEIERLARDALTDVRAALAGYREVSLGAELAGAGHALAAAGVTAHLPGAVDADLSEPVRELFGWTVREAVTNVVRHSGATRCWVELGPTAVEVRDDGIGPRQGARSGEPGSGLPGLASRAAEAGARLEVGRAPEGGFRLRVTTESASPALSSASTAEVAP